MKTTIFVLLCIIVINGIWAEENEEIQTQTDLTLVFSTVREMQFELEKRIISLFLQGTNAMTADNNITLKLRQ
jgi:hypothetical protein